MTRAAEWFSLVTCVVVGLSHVLQPRAWAEAYAALHRLGRPGAFVNGAVHLVPGAALVAAHPVWSGPGVVLTVLGWLLVLKGAVCFLAPEVARRSMARGAAGGTGRGFVGAGAALLGLAGALGYALWAR